MDDSKKITRQQQRAIHLYFRMVADMLNEAGYTVEKTLSKSIEIDWNPILVKEIIWRGVQHKETGKISTTELTTSEVDKVFDTINRHLGEKFGLHTPFPSIEELIIQQNYETRKKYNQ